MGWQTIGALDEILGSGGTLDRESAGEVVLLRHLVPALKKLNPKAPPEAIDAAVNDLTHDRSVMSLSAANGEVYALLRSGVKVKIRTRRASWCRSGSGSLTGIPRRTTTFCWCRSCG